MRQPRNPASVYAELMQQQPKLHGRRTSSGGYEAGGDWSLSPATLQWLVDHIEPGFRTLETGCGYSTVVFAAWECRHDVISPLHEEHAAISEWCREHGVTVESVRYHVGPSQRILPALPPTPLDLVLVDGDHAVPAPLIDYYYTADRLVKGGVMLVDDVQLRSVQQLCEFLDAEKERWEPAGQVARTAIYRKRVEGNVAEGVHFQQQPFVSAPPGPGLLGQAARTIKRALGR
jgi:predicted O-methyltransferase YrrM